MSIDITNSGGKQNDDTSSGPQNPANVRLLSEEKDVEATNPSASASNENGTNACRADVPSLSRSDARVGKGDGVESPSGGGCSRLRPKQALGVLPLVCVWLRSPGVAAGWYVVAIACAQELLNGFIWATFGPIARTAVCSSSIPNIWWESKGYTLVTTMRSIITRWITFKKIEINIPSKYFL